MKEEDVVYKSIEKLNDNMYFAYAPAKLNITLSIGKKEKNGFHNISSIMQTISLHDRITLKKVETGKTSMEGIIIDKNIVEDVIENLSIYVNKKLPCRISISKAIPIFAGLGGGSSDAATVLRIANKAFNLELKSEELECIACKVGNDISFLLYGGRAIVEGSLKHKITQIETPNFYYVIAKPKMKMSTKEMYEIHDKTDQTFTEIAFDICPDTKKLLEKMREFTPMESGVTGKGPTVFAGFKTYKECEVLSKKLLLLNGDVFIEKSVDHFI